MRTRTDLSFLHDAASFHRPITDQPMPKLMPEAEHLFRALANSHAAGAGYEEVENELHSFMLHPAVLELCRTAVLSAMRGVHNSRQHWQDLFMETWQRLLAKLRRAFEQTVMERGEDGRRLLGFREGKGGRHPFPAWLFTVLRNGCIEAIRKSLRHDWRRALDVPLEQLADKNVTPAERHEEELDRALAELDEPMRRVLRGLLDGMSGNEIARQQGRSPAVVSRLKRLGIARLRLLLGLPG